MMRSPAKYLVCATVVSVISLAWWWVTWPDRVLDEFIQCIERGDFETARAMIDTSKFQHEDLTQLNAALSEAVELGIESRTCTFRDYLSGRHEYFCQHTPVYYDLTIKMGRVDLGSSFGPWPNLKRALKLYKAEQARLEQSENNPTPASSKSPDSPVSGPDPFPDDPFNPH